MCVAELNVSTRPCNHRWYHLVRSCSEGNNLENCSRKLGLEGWEIRCDFCPYCDAWEIDNASYRLFGGGRNPSVATSNSLTRKASTSLSSTRRESRRGSLSRNDSNTSLTMLTHSVKNRATNARLDNYLSSRPERMLSVDSRPSELTDDEDASPTASESSSNGNPTSTHAKPSVFGKSLKKSKKMKKFFSFVK